MPGTTTNGLPYPLDTEPWADMPSTIRLLAEAIDKDSGDLKPAAGSGFSGALRVFRVGKLCILTGYLDRDDSFGTNWTPTTVVVPVGFRPLSGETSQALPGYGTTQQYRYRVNPDGTVDIQRTGIITTWMAVTNAYLAA